MEATIWGFGLGVGSQNLCTILVPQHIRCRNIMYSPKGPIIFFRILHIGFTDGNVGSDPN